VIDRRVYLIALFTVLLAVVGFREVAYTRTVPERQPLQRFPEQVGGWTGQTGFLDPDILAALRVDDYLLRIYRDRAGNEVGFYVAYYGSQPPDSRIHSPAVCLPGAGWYIADAGTVPIRFQDRIITVNRNVVQKGEQKQVVLYWYQIHGRVAARELQAVTLLAWTSLTERRTDEALVRINAPIAGTVQDALQRAVAFAEGAFAPLARLLPN
jgi:EpsI family protein